MPDNGVQVATDALYVVDGDTLHGPGRARYRLIGVNTPELRLRNAAAEPQAQAAADFVSRWLAARQAVRLVAGRDVRDSHGRSLVYVVGPNGRSLAWDLVRAGLGFRIAFTPNLMMNACLIAAERQARTERLGVWTGRYFRVRNARSLRPQDAGFRLVSGRVIEVASSKRHIWLEFDGDLVVRARHDVLTDPDALVGREITVRGWLIDRQARHRLESGRARYLINIHHVSAIEHDN